MHYTFFHILSIDSEKETDRLNRFLQKHTIHSIDRQFVTEGSNSFWSICVVTHDQQNASHLSNKSSTSKKKQRIDYQQELSPEHFTIFDKLRELRNQIVQENTESLLLGRLFSMFVSLLFGWVYVSN